MLDRLKGFWRRNRTYILVAFALYVLITALLLLLSSGAERSYFVYQVF